MSSVNGIQSSINTNLDYYTKDNAKKSYKIIDEAYRAMVTELGR